MMFNINYLVMRIFLVLALILFIPKAFANEQCINLFIENHGSNVSPNDSKPPFSGSDFNPLLSESNLAEHKQAASRNMGVHHEMFGTTVYTQALENSDQMRGFPGIRQDAKAVAICLGGGGTRFSTGRTFGQHGRVFDDYRISMISVDYPFHGKNLGRNDQRYMNAELFLKQIIQIVDFYMRAGKPVIFLGHSFGATVLKEILFRRPDLAMNLNKQILGMFLASPGGSITPELMAYYKQNEGNILAKAYADDFIDEIGGLWIDLVELGFKISDGRKVEHQVPIRIISGDKDLLNTPSLLYGLRDTLNPDVTEVQVIPDVGHQIFHFRGDTHNMLLETMLGYTRDALGLKDLPQVEDRMVRTKEIKTLEANSELFRHWMKVSGKNLNAITRDWRTAKGALKEWNLWYSKLLVLEVNKIIKVIDKDDIASIDKNHLARIKSALNLELKDMNEQAQTDLVEFILFAQRRPGLRSRIQAWR